MLNAECPIGAAIAELEHLPPPQGVGDCAPGTNAPTEPAWMPIEGVVKRTNQLAREIVFVLTLALGIVSPLGSCSWRRHPRHNRVRRLDCLT